MRVTVWNASITSVTFQAVPFGFNLEVETCVSEELLISATYTSQAARAASARAFVHSLNILIKYARMYGYTHKRTEAQFETTWKDYQLGLFDLRFTTVPRGTLLQERKLRRLVDERERDD